MANFDEAVAIVLRHEGGYVNNPSDPGGETNFGISKRAYPSVDMKTLTRDEAKLIYRRDYWLTLYDQVTDQRLANGLFDFGVNAGTAQAVKTLQKALNDVLAGPILTDGVFGPGTLSAVNAANPDKLMMRFNVRRITYYASLNKPEFVLGWVTRALDINPTT